jgi:hypothetical protein
MDGFRQRPVFSADAFGFSALADADAKSKDIKARLRPAGGTFAGDDVKQSQSFE